MNQSTSINQVLSHRQTTTLAPQLQQGVRLLKLSTAELQTEIELALESNPFLEKIDFDEGVETLSDQAAALEKQAKKREHSRSQPSDRIQAYAAKSSSLTQINTTAAKPSDSGAGIDIDVLMNTGQELSLHGYLRQQASETPLSEKQHFILDILIDSVNDKGYLRASIDDVMQMAMPYYVVNRKGISQLIGTLQEFEPVGVGARTASECLAIQLRELPADTPALKHARQIVKDYLLALAKKEYSNITTKLGIDKTQLQEAIALIRTLNPFPGSSIATPLVRHIAPDLIVKKLAGEWIVRLNPNLAPAVNIHQESAQLLELAKGQEGYQGLKQTLRDAKILLSNIERRYQTLLRVGSVIVRRQQAFLERGESALKPLAQKEIADLLEIHVSTVSRAINDKFLLTPNGVVELRHLFCSAINCQSGEAISSSAIQEKIKELIAQESKAKPLSDNKITAMLAQQRVVLARRTVMKYREQIGIPASPKRRASAGASSSLT